MNVDLNDHIRIWKGNDENGTLVADITSKSRVPVYEIRAGQVLMVFSSDESIAEYSFRILFGK